LSLQSEISKNSLDGKNPDQENQNRLPPTKPFSRFIYTSLLWGTGFILLVLLSTGVWIWTYASTPSHLKTSTTILIPKGVGVRQIRTILAEHGIVGDDIRFLILARLTDSAGHLKAGEFIIPPGLTPVQILKILETGDVILHQVTIPEGMTNRQVADILSQKNWVDLQRFILLTKDKKFIQSLGLNQSSLEGYLFPDTYLLTRNEMTEKSLISMMVKRFQQVWEVVSKNQKTKMMPHEVLTLASIVEKETGEASERSIISKVFLNRLNRGMRLQSDPTVIYGIPEFNGNLTRKDLKKETPYNTYVISGLPPGPICNPGKEAIEAVLNPADVPYIYFVSKKDGTHHFSTNLNEHNRAVRTYQKK